MSQNLNQMLENCKYNNCNHIEQKNEEANDATKNQSHDQAKFWSWKPNILENN